MAKKTKKTSAGAAGKFGPFEKRILEGVLKGMASYFRSSEWKGWLKSYTAGLARTQSGRGQKARGTTAAKKTPAKTTGQPRKARAPAETLTA